MPAKTTRVEVRVSPGEKEAWAAAAGGSRRISEWLRSIANREAREPAEDPTAPVQGVSRALPQRDDLTGPVEALDAAGFELGPADAPNTSGAIQVKGKATSRVLPECPRWMHHRPGVYCASCKKVR